MQIIEFQWHPQQRLYSGHAESTRGRRYFFGLDEKGQMRWVDREERKPWNGFWFHLRHGPSALTSTARVKVHAHRKGGRTD